MTLPKLNLPFPYHRPPAACIKTLKVDLTPKHAARRIAYKAHVNKRSIGLDAASERAVELLMAVYEPIKFAGLCRIALQALAQAANQRAIETGTILAFVADDLVDPRFQQPEEPLS